MKRTIKKLFRQYLAFSRSDRNAIVVLSMLIMMAVLANILVRNIKPKSVTNQYEFERIWKEWNKSNPHEIDFEQRLFLFDPNKISEKRLDSLLIPSFIKRNLISYRESGGKFNSADDFRKLYGMNDSIYNVISTYINIEKVIKSNHAIEVNKKDTKISGYFDPNQTNVDELKKFGFNEFQTNNLLSYIENGGVFNAVEDLRKIYGIDSSFYSKIKNHVQIEKGSEQTVLNIQPEIEVVELNSADSSQLVRLNGIGPTYAMRILRYRELLGGFYSKEQLLEVYNFPEETYQKIESAIEIDTLRIKKIRLNFADFKELLRHPYLSKSQVEAILTHRQKNGIFSNVSSIQDIEGINKEAFSRISPYFTCR